MDLGKKEFPGESGTSASLLIDVRTGVLLLLYYIFNFKKMPRYRVKNNLLLIMQVRPFSDWFNFIGD